MNHQPQQAAYTVDQFRTNHGGMSRTLFYDLLKTGKGPRIFKVGRRTMISAEAAAEWIQRMEAEHCQQVEA